MSSGPWGPPKRSQCITRTESHGQNRSGTERPTSRNAVIGLTRAARNAGTHAAVPAISNIPVAAPA